MSYSDTKKSTFEFLQLTTTQSENISDAHAVFLSNASKDLYINFTSNVTMAQTMNESTYSPGEAAVGVVLAMFSFITIAGNILVIVAVTKELYLRTVTNYFIVSLAVADLMVGSIVMPFAITLEMTGQVWLFGPEWCDMWHSFDVLASTASILNLCGISLDRYWAISDPIKYTSRMTVCRTWLSIALVWLLSAGISFPAIAWWKAVTPDLPAENECIFTSDSAYLIISSLVSFYCPSIIMMVVYWRIYMAATAQIRSLKVGQKTLTSNGARGNREVMTLRIHRGGGGTTMSRQSSDEYAQSFEKCLSDCERQTLVTNGKRNSDSASHRPARCITKRIRQFAISKKLTKVAREQKAAKTLGIVVGVFILCWVPFFVFNILEGICHDTCLTHKDILFPLFTWLGYINSGMNPIIYALSMKDFRRAFGKIIFCFCPKTKFQYHNTYQSKKCSSTSSFVVVTQTERG
ncbi:dopamine receptor 2-like [Saccostrea echinata]|uniref:dopamine receptor 2-like n=1 Tax=Saccostrea echinata TaxID=191078 RepID=UPI002A833DEE|nr:dopamine receptor 2-like [Saccostrea echinata]